MFILLQLSPWCIIPSILLGSLLAVTLQALFAEYNNNNCINSLYNIRNLIPIQRAKEMYKLYSKRIDNLQVGIKATAENKNLSAIDCIRFNHTRYGEYDLTTFKQYMLLLECIEKKYLKSSQKLSTIRIYLGVHPNNTIVGEQDNDTGRLIPYSCQTTMFFVPTIEDDGEIKEFYLSQDANKSITVETRNDFYVPNGEEANFGEIGNVLSSLILDEINLTPPPPQ